MYEYLKPILGDELFAQFVEKMNGATGVTLVNTADGSFVPKAKFDDANDKAKTLNQQIATLTAQLQEAQQQNGDTASLTAQIEKLTADVTARDEQIAKLGLTYRIKDALRGMNVRNADVVMPLLKMDSISEQDGKLVGLNEQVEEIKKSDSYLFTDSGRQYGNFGLGRLARQSGRQGTTFQRRCQRRHSYGRWPGAVKRQNKRLEELNYGYH